VRDIIERVKRNRKRGSQPIGHSSSMDGNVGHKDSGGICNQEARLNPKRKDASEEENPCEPVPHVERRQ